MRFSQGIVKHGTEGVRAYREIAGVERDNRIPEISIGSWIARGLHEDFRVKARVECRFTEMAKDLGHEVGLDLVNVMGAGAPTLRCMKVKAHGDGTSFRCSHHRYVERGLQDAGGCPRPDAAAAAR